MTLLLFAPLLIVAVIHRKRGRRWSEPAATVLLAVTVVVIGMALSGGNAAPAVAVPAPMPFLSPPPPPPGCTLPTAPITGTRVISYTYDPLGRLSQAAQSDGACYQYKYDQVGNRTALTTTAGVTTYGYDAANRLTSVGGQTYTWDNAGRLTNNGRFTYTYNTAGLLRMTQAQGITATQVYTYNGDGLLMARNTAKYVYDQAADLPQMLSDGNTLYIPGVGQWNGKEWTYELPDGLGSTRQLADAQGYLVQRYDYSPFGEALTSEGQRTNSLRYTGEQWDSDVGLLYLRARWYDPSVGRFTTRDPFPGFSALPQTQHPYVYATNNPISLTDPSGKIIPLLIPVGAAAVGAVIGGVGGGIAYAMSHPCDDYLHSDGFWRAVGVGALSGGVAGLVGWAVPALLPAAGFWGAVGVGALSGSLAGGTGQIVVNLFTPNAAWYAGVPDAMLVGGVTGGIAGGVGYGIRQWVTRSANQWAATRLADDATYAHQRAMSLQRLLGKSRGWVTMAVGVADGPGGERVVLVGSNEPGSYLRSGVRTAILPGETVVSGIGHAEEKIVNHALENNLLLRAVGSGRPICEDCERAILNAGAIPASPTRSGNIYIP